MGKIKRNRWSNLVSFFQLAISLLAYLATFSGQLYFRRNYFFTLFQSNYFRAGAVFSFFRTVTEQSQELFFQNSFFFGAKIIQSSDFLRIASSLPQLLSGTAIFLEELFRIKISKKELPFQSRYFCTAPIFSEKPHFGKKLIFQKMNFRITYFFWRAVLLEQLLFQKALPSNSSYLSRRATFLQHSFSEELLFHSCGSFPLLHFSFIR